MAQNTPMSLGSILPDRSLRENEEEQPAAAASWRDRRTTRRTMRNDSRIPALHAPWENTRIFDRDARCGLGAAALFGNAAAASRDRSP